MLSAVFRTLACKQTTTASAARLSTSPISMAGSPRSSKREDRIREQQNRREKWAQLKTGHHRMRLSSLKSGRSGGGQSQLMEARQRLSRSHRAKFDNARDFVNRTTTTQEERALAEARILRQRSRQLKKRKAPGMGFTPARFRLMDIENESGSDLMLVGREGKRGVAMREVKKVVEMAEFETLGLAKEVAMAARQLLDEQHKNKSTGKDGVKPTEIQALGIPEILGRSLLGKPPATSQHQQQGPSVFLAAETGGGKTLAYALPLMSQLKQEEQRAAGNKAVRREQRPRALVVVPSRELVAQVTATFKRLGHSVKLRVVGVHLGVARRVLRDSIDSGPIDIMVSTPGAVLRYMTRDRLLSPADLRYLVVDEADSLMDSHSFGGQTSAVLDLVRRANQTQGRREQAVFVSATLPKMVREHVIGRYPDIVHVATSALHRAPKKLAQTFIDVSRDYQGHRLNALWFVLRTAANDRHLMVFCNTKAHANLVHRQLFRRGVPALLLLGGDPQSAEKHRGAKNKDAERSVAARRPPKDADAWERATWSSNASDEQPQALEQAEESVAEPINGVDIADLDAPVPWYDREEVLRAFYSDQPVPEHLLPNINCAVERPLLEPLVQQQYPRKIMVCTDLASRGLDTTCVSHVVLFDFPTTAIDYLHRSGRTARAGTRGKVSALVGKKDRRLADQIRLAIRQGGVI